MSADIKITKYLFSFYLGSTPEDEAPEVPNSNTFMVPRKEISMVPDMGKWKRSQVGVAFKSSSYYLTFQVLHKKYRSKSSIRNDMWLFLSLILSLGSAQVSHFSLKHLLISFFFFYNLNMDLALK